MAKAKTGPASHAHKRTYRTQTAALTRGFAVKQGTADDQAVLAGANERVLGVVDESTLAVDDPASIVLLGECIAIAGGVVTAGMPVKSDAAGNFVDASAADVETAGRALSGAAAQFDEFLLFVNPNHKRS